MTYCVAIKLNTGMVFLSDTRTNAGVDLVNTFRKMTVFETPGDRTIVLMTSGNLSISQSVVQHLMRQQPVQNAVAVRVGIGQLSRSA
mgnify:CR=1 FL=1